ncbi:hypothetical protein M409DRAFT_36326 [Zasmidium cellare ATCC 36951]|uniref:Major facilitator superfamily (MFS) profile domain-containing protein n=1 Tax=Zasmidium cellare ATCC 36951 TaxID=1080233 RepID=A0A6A6CNQ6_ZASCE|nr:uncharacterized protein M409DRAFT_36326 [Zasmidium cellare ATCC 36951]KAF2168681.1 hypothetical protein M409DRAFT_36326 [Zasmidium cellare ATCC 36951]
MSRINKADDVALQLEEADTFGNEDAVKPVYIPNDESSHKKTKAERRFITKCDFVIVPLGALLYFVAYVDRNSIGNARVLGTGMQNDLGLSGDQWKNCLSMFFVGYIIFMLPGNILIKVLRPNRHLGGTALLFGALLAAMSAASNYATVVALRLLIGAAQAFLQGISIYCSLWYKRDEFATRLAFVYWAATISGAFSGLIAYAVGDSLRLENTGRDSWRWLFIIEGSMAMFVGILVWLILPPSPESLKQKTWLLSSEEVAIESSLNADIETAYNTHESRVDWRQILTTMKDPKSWVFASLNCGVSLGVSSISLFLPTFIHELGFSGERTQLFSVIPYACASCVIPLSLVSDRLNIKGPFLLGTILVTCTGYIILLCEVSVAAKIVACCIAASGLYPSVILMQAWIVGNMAGYTKRATSWAMAEIFGQCFGVLASHVYTTPPRFIKGHAIVLGLLLYAAVMTVALMWWMMRANKKKQEEILRYESEGMVHPHKLKSLEEVQDFHIDFKYII